jgi:putative transposase
MIERDNKEIPINRQCKLLGVSRSIAYYKPVPLSEEEIKIKNAIDRIYTDHPYYGCRRIQNQLKDRYGICISRKKVQRYMREMRIDAIYPGLNLSKKSKQNYIYPYLLRNLQITHKNQVWGIDLTYIGLSKGWMYLVVIIDWYSRFLVGWGLSNTLHVNFVLEALKKAFTRYGIPEIINSNQGSHFTSKDYTSLLKEREIKISMNGKGRATDNAITERFIRNLKHEKLYLMELENGHQVSKAISSYITEYNFIRRHQGINDMKPSELYFQPSEETHQAV